MHPLESAKEAAADLWAHSRRAHSSARELLNEPNTMRSLAHIRIVSNLIAQISETSQAVEHLIRDEWSRPAIALARVHLEQTIVLTYLMNVPAREGLDPFSRHGPITELRIARSVADDAVLSRHLPPTFDMNVFVAKAAASLGKDVGDFSLDHGAYRAKWTALDVYSMALRCDDLTKLAMLAPTYKALYRPASAIVHCDPASLGAPFTGETAVSGGGTVPAHLFWRLALTGYVAQLDVVNCLGIAKWLGHSVPGISWPGQPPVQAEG